MWGSFVVYGCNIYVWRGDDLILYVDMYVLRAGSTTNHLVCTNCRSVIDCWVGSSLVLFFLFGSCS